MGFKLLVLSLWTPKFVIRRMLTQISNDTTAALKSLSTDFTGESQGIFPSKDAHNSETIEQRRAAMASQHAQLVDALVAAQGRDSALNLGRAAVFQVGRDLGAQARSSLGVGNNPADLIRAAKILYRVLGIEFAVEWTGNEAATLVVNRCALAKEYSNLTCSVLSATDEGVMQGLNPDAKMKFRETITAGCPQCKADILFAGETHRK